MSDLSVPTLVVVTNLRGGIWSVVVDVVTLVLDESKGDPSRLSVTTTTPPPSWYADIAFPVESITADVQGDRIFTGYVTSWKRGRPAGTWVLEALDVLYVAENEWLLPPSITQMSEFSGQVTELISFLLEDTCNYATVTIANVPFTLGGEEPFEFGFESVKDLIDRLGSILQTELWADADGGVHWGFKSDFPDDSFGAECSVDDCTEGGIFYYNRNRGTVWTEIGANCGAYRIAINAAYATYNTAEEMLAEHRQYPLPGETAVHPTRGNLLSWDQTEDEDTYRIGAVVYGLPPIKVTVLKGDFPLYAIRDLNNIAIVSSALIQEEWIAQDVANMLSQQSSVKRTATWEAVGNTNFHVNLTHFVDTIEFFGYGKVLSVTHTVDDNGYTIRGESRLGEGEFQPSINTIQCSEHILSADVSGGVERYEGTWEMVVTYNATTGEWENSAAQFTYSYAWSDISLPAWSSDIHEVVWVHSPASRSRPTDGSTAFTEGYALAINNQGIWRNYWAGDWEMTTAEIADEWDLIMAAAEWTSAASVGFAAGRITCIQLDGASSRWDGTLTPSMTHFMVREPDFMLETGIIRFGVLASGPEYYAGAIGGWISSSHIFTFQATLALGNLTNLSCTGAVHSTGGAYAPWAGWWNWAGWSYTKDTALLWARPLNYAWGAICYSLSATISSVSAAFTAHGGTWFDSSQRFNRMVDARWGLCSMSGNSVRGYTAERCAAGGGAVSIDVPTIGGGGLLDWRGVSLWGGIEYGKVLALQGVQENTEFGRWVASWEGSASAPFIADWTLPWPLMIYLITTDGKVHRQARTFESPRAPGAYTTPEEELWDTLLGNLGALTLDGGWTQLLDWGGGNFSIECPYLINPYTAALYVNGQRFLPISAAGGSVDAIGKGGSTIYNFAPCGRDHRQLLKLYDDGTTSEVKETPPCCKKAEDPQCCGTKPLRGPDGVSATECETPGLSTVRF